MATEKDPPLYLHITGASKEIIEDAVKHIEEILEIAARPQEHFRRPGFENVRVYSLIRFYHHCTQ